MNCESANDLANLMKNEQITVEYEMYLDTKMRFKTVLQIANGEISEDASNVTLML